jgi:hypothetical protein
MPDEGGEPPDPSAPSVPPAPSPEASASSQVVRPTGRVSVYEFDPDHQRRFAEATVRKLEIEAEQADNDREMRKDIAERIFKAISVQVVIADLAFLVYGFWNGWEIPGSTISAWLGAVVVQVIAVGLVIARSLFPPEKKSQ